MNIRKNFFFYLLKQIMALIEREKIPTIDQITDRVYLGDIEAANNQKLLDSLHIECIVNISNCLPEEYHRHKNIDYFDISDVPDHPKEPIHEWFDKVNQFIADQAPKRVLIHCMNAVSRSVSLVLAHLIAENKWKVCEAYDYLCSKRGKQYTKPNRGFLKRLLTYECQQLNNENPSISLIELIQHIEERSSRS